jgi:hypothetical protein
MFFWQYLTGKELLKNFKKLLHRVGKLFMPYNQCWATLRMRDRELLVSKVFEVTGTGSFLILNSFQRTGRVKQSMSDHLR